MIVRICDENEMLKRLTEGNLPPFMKPAPVDPHMRERFFPLLTAHAGKKLAASEVLEAIYDAIRKYTEGFEHTTPTPLVANILKRRAQEWIDAMVATSFEANEVKGRLHLSRLTEYK